MIQKVKFITTATIVSVGIISIFLAYLLSVAAVPRAQADLNASFVSIVYPSCQQCSNIANLLFSFLSSRGYQAPRVSLYFGSAAARNFIDNELITALPAVTLPATTGSADLLNELVYLNIFNFESNSFVLNTPFVSALTRNVTYFSILQNRTVSAFDIYNISNIYGVNQSSGSLRLLNPMEVLLQFNSINLTSGNKTDIIFVYSDSPFSAIQSLVVKRALDDFGYFNSSVTFTSERINASFTLPLGPTPSYDLSKMHFSSNSFDLEAYNITSIPNPTVQRELFQYDQNAVSDLGTVYGSFTPFFDIGGRFISVSSMLLPSVLNGFNITAAYRYIDTNSTIGSLFNDSVAFIDAMLCSYDNYNSICNTTIVRNQEYNILHAVSG